MNRKVIYTSLVGKYDSLTDPKYIMENWDYICFSNNVNKIKNSVWQIKPIPFKHRDKIILSRYVKMNPHLVLREYDFSLWIDANVEILDDFVERRVNELIRDQCNLSLIPHPFRDCIYKEARVCIESGLGSRKIIEKQVNFLKSEKYPENNGLFENGLIFRYHNHKQISALGRDWWNIYLEYSKRDQLSLCYLLWKYDIHCEPFTQKGLSVRNIPSIRLTPHESSLLQKMERHIQIKINNIKLPASMAMD
ncbi:glycosyltransferase domain-containing protein [Bacteroidota bacterium]